MLDVSIAGAQGVLFNITGGSDLKLTELHEAAKVIQREVDPDANIIFGMATHLNMENEIKLTIIATGFDRPDNTKRREDRLARQLASDITNESVNLDIPPFLRRYTAQSGN